MRWFTFTHARTLSLSLTHTYLPYELLQLRLQEELLRAARLRGQVLELLQMCQQGSRALQ